MSIADYLAALPARYQDIAISVYKDRCSLVRDTSSNDGRGGWIDTPSTIASDIPCTFVPRATNQREVLVAGKPVGFADGDVWLPAQFDGALLDAKATDRIVMQALGTEPTRTLEIIFPAPHQGVLIQAAVRYLPNV